MIIIDTTYFGRGRGVMVFRDCWSKRNLLWYFVNYETIALYVQGIRELQKLGFIVKGVVADGRRGIFHAFEDIPVQMCHFHQKQIIRRYLSLNPKLEAGIELKQIVEKLTRTDEDSLAGWLEKWRIKWGSFLKEKTYQEDGRWSYTHKKLRSAYRSISVNMEYLYAYHQEKGMPNTTNSLDGSFGQLKRKLNVHSGLKWHRKKKVIEQLLIKNSRTKC